MFGCCEGFLTVSQARRVQHNRNPNLCRVRSVGHTSARKCKLDAQSWSELVPAALPGRVRAWQAV